MPTPPREDDDDDEQGGASSVPADRDNGDGAAAATGHERVQGVEYGDLLKTLMARLVDREEIRERAFLGTRYTPSCRETTARAVEELIGRLRGLLARMLRRSCSTEQLSSVQQTALRILLVGSRANFEAFVVALAIWFDKVEQWPTTPTAPDDKQKARDILYYYLNGQVLQLKRTDPLPPPEFMSRPAADYACFVCREPLQASYQAVDVDGMRDRATYSALTRRGLDLCFRCSHAWCKKSARRLQSRMLSCPYARRNHINHCSPGQLHIEAARFSHYDDSIVVHLKGTPGLYAVACAYPQAAKQKRTPPTLPPSWFKGRPPFSTRLTPPDAPGRTCTICAEEVFADTKCRGPVVATPCGHEFHSHCILTRQRGVDGEAGVNECPNCRTRLGESGLKPTDDIVTETLIITHDNAREPIRQQTYEIAVVLCQDDAAPIDSAFLVAVTLLKPKQRDFWTS
eukprot:TRINITY_DN9262_c0_g1_i1.p1 TRINITY_DN9262_c0_g1~~TRINITY_DN9262_c0_g1_i1.p1  ORF type:complete len:457 (+),score=84.31 TRINITY_DN9262_c0_g1_i1:78-1448(+)